MRTKGFVRRGERAIDSVREQAFARWRIEGDRQALLIWQRPEFRRARRKRTEARQRVK